MDELQKPLSYSLSLKIGIAAFAVVLSFLCSFSPFFLWVATVPLFVLALNDRRLISVFIIFLAEAVGSFLQVFYTYFHTIFPYQNTLLPIGVDSLFFTGILWLASVCVHRLKSWYTIFAFSTLWVSYLYLCILFASNGAITSLPTFSQVQFLPIVQIVAITGILGLSFLTCLMSSGLVVGWYYSKRLPKQAVGSLLTTLVLFAAVFAFGIIQLYIDESFPKLKVGLVAQDPHDIESFLATRDKDSISKARGFAETVSHLAKMGAKYILPPEKAIWVTPEDQETIEAFAKLAIFWLAPENRVSFVKNMRYQETLPHFAPKFSKTDFKLTDFGRDETLIST